MIMMPPSIKACFVSPEQNRRRRPFFIFYYKFYTWLANNKKELNNPMTPWESSSTFSLISINLWENIQMVFYLRKLWFKKVTYLYLLSFYVPQKYQLQIYFSRTQKIDKKIESSAVSIKKSRGYMSYSTNLSILSYLTIV